MTQEEQVNTSQRAPIAKIREEYEESSLSSFHSILDGDEYIFPTSDGERLLTLAGNHLCVVHARDGNVLHKTPVGLPEVTDASNNNDQPIVTACSLSPFSYPAAFFGKKSAHEETSRLTVICTATSDGNLKLYALGASQFTLIREWIGTKRSTIRDVCFSPDGMYIVSCCADGSAKVWSVVTNTTVSTMPPRPGRLTSVSFMDIPMATTKSSSCPVLLAFGTEIGEVTVWNTHESKAQQRFNDSTQRIVEVHFIASSRSLLVASADQTVFCYKCPIGDTQTNPTVFVLHDKFLVKEPINDVCFIEKCLPLYSESGDSPIDADLLNDKVSAGKAHSHSDTDVFAVIAFTSGNISAYAISGVIAPKDGAPQRRVTKVGARTATEIGNHPITKMRYCASQEIIWCATSDNVMYSLQTPSLAVESCFVSALNAVLGLDTVRINESERALLVANNTATPIVMKSGSNICLRQLIGHDDTVLCMTTACDGRVIATGAKDKTIRLWRQSVSKSHTDALHDGFHCVAIATCGEEVNGLTFMSYDSHEQLALVSTSTDDCVNVWRVKCEKQRKRKVVDESTRSPGETLFFSLSRGEITLENSVNHTISGVHAKIAAGKPSHRAGGNVFSLTASNGEKHIATGGRDKAVCIYQWDPTKGISREVTLTGHKKSVYCLLFHPTDAGILASGSGDCTVKLWSLYSNTCEQTFQGHDSAVVSITFITEGLQLVSGDTGGIIRIWRANSGVCVCTLSAQNDGKIWALHSQHSGDTILSGSSDGVIQCWEDATERKALERNRTKAERHENTTRLEECLHSKNYADGVRRAVELKQPRFAYKFLRLFLAECIREAPKLQPEDMGGKETLESIMASLGDQSVLSLLGFCVDWMRVSSRSSVAQACVNAVLCTRPPAFLWELDSVRKAQNVGGTDAIGTMMKFTEKYATRVQNILRESFTMEYLEFCNSGIGESLLTVENS